MNTPSTLSIFRSLRWVAIVSLLVRVAAPVGARAQSPTPPDAVVASTYSFSGNTGAPPFTTLVPGPGASGVSFLGTSSSHSSNFYYYGGYGSGTIFEVFGASDSGLVLPLYAFSATDVNGVNGDGASPNGLVLASDGNYYGTTYSGGQFGYGTFFQFTPGGTLTTFYNFGAPGQGNTLPDGAYPNAALVEAPDGYFYGTTTSGGANSTGTVFRITAAGALTTLHSFDTATTSQATYLTTNTEGVSISSALVAATDGSGNLYGSAHTGGANGEGTIFQVEPDGTLTVLHTFTSEDSNFDNADGASPNQLLLGYDGNLYGTASYGGTSADGTIFRIATSGGTLTTLYSFGTNTSDGAYPYAGLVEDGDGNFYGTTSSGGSSYGLYDYYSYGTVFMLPAAGGTLTTLFNFSLSNGTYGGDPSTALILGSDGNLYGTTQQGGADGEGTLFSVIKDDSGDYYLNAASFGFGSYSQAVGGLIQGLDGNLYGVSAHGGSFNTGAIFQFPEFASLISYVPTTIYNFGSLTAPALNASGTALTGVNADGAIPATAVIQGKDGNFYGATGTGGAYGNGVIYQVTSGGTPNVLHAFTALNGSGVNTDGSGPTSLIQGLDGNFYGTTSSGGANGNGVIFQLTPAGALQVLYAFGTLSGSTDGASPVSLIQGADGNFYGVTSYGGMNGNGVIFQLTVGVTPKILYNFSAGNNVGDNADGAQPISLIQGTDGNFYGLTSSGGASGNGTVFSVTASGGFTLLHSFDYTDGGNPAGALLQASDGNFYGVTTSGGTNGVGTIFQITPAGTLTTIVTNFSGGFPNGSLIEGSDHHLYGTTRNINTSYDTDGSVFALTVSPTIVSAGTASSLLNAPFNYQIQATFGPTSYAATGLPAGLQCNPTTGLINGTAAYSGFSTVTISATNAAGTSSATLLITIEPPPPAITSLVPSNGQVGVSYSYSLAASNNPTSYGAIGLPPGLQCNAVNGLISGMPTQAGTYQVAFTATNNGGTGTTNYSITILPAVPVISSAASTSGVAGVMFSYQITASNSPSSFNAIGLPAGLSVGTVTGLITGIPTQVGTSSVILQALNSGGTGTASLTLVVTAAPTNLLPLVTSAAAGTATVGTAYTYSITATNNPIVYTASGLPTGLTLDPNTGLISGTPTVSGTFNVALTAANALGSGPAATLTLTVNPAPQDITSFSIVNPPSNSTVPTGSPLYTYVVVGSLPNTLQSVVVSAIDNTSGTQTLLGTSSVGVFQETWQVPETPGPFTLHAVATDITGKTQTFSVPITVETASAGQVPTVTTNIDAIQGRNFAPGSALTIVADVTASIDPLDKVDFYDNSAIFQTYKATATTSATRQSAHKANADDDSSESVTPYMAQYIVPPSGSVALTAGATTLGKFYHNALGGVATALAGLIDSDMSVTVTPSSDSVSTISTGQVTVNASRNNGHITEVELYVGSKRIGTGTSVPYTVTLPTLVPGTYTMTAIATDDSLPISKQSAPVTLTVVEAMTVSAAATPTSVSRSGGGEATVTFTRTGSTTEPLLVYYTVGGGLVNGTDFAALNGRVKIRANKKSVSIHVVPLAGGGDGKVKITLRSATGYTVGSTKKVKVKITQ